VSQCSRERTRSIARTSSRPLEGPDLAPRATVAEGPPRLPPRENFTRQTPVCAPPLFALLSRAPRAASFFLHARSLRRPRPENKTRRRRNAASSAKCFLLRTGRILSRRPLRARARARAFFSWLADFRADLRASTRILAHCSRRLSSEACPRSSHLPPPRPSREPRRSSSNREVNGLIPAGLFLPDGPFAAAASPRSRDPRKIITIQGIDSFSPLFPPPIRPAPPRSFVISMDGSLERALVAILLPHRYPSVAAHTSTPCLDAGRMHRPSERQGGEAGGRRGGRRRVDG